MTDFTRISSPEDLAQTQGRLVLNLDGTDIHLDWRPAPGARRIIFGFHGAIDREKRTVPSFAGLPSSSTQNLHSLMLADPSLNQHDKLRIGWYAGNSNFAAQRLISVFCQQATQVLKVDRAIYFGSSAGGFPALLYSWHHAGSLALVSNAHTNIANYYSGHVSDYVALCWPGHDDVRDLPGTVTDLRTLYGKQVPNNVVFIQNNTDTFHLFNHAIPFLGAITNHDDRAKITTEMVYPGKTGHGPVWSAIAPWLMAALTAPSWSAIDLIETRHRLSQKASPAPATAAPKQHMAAGFAPADLELAALLRNAQLPPLPKGAQ